MTDEQLERARTVGSLTQSLADMLKAGWYVGFGDLSDASSQSSAILNDAAQVIQELVAEVERLRAENERLRHPALPTVGYSAQPVLSGTLYLRPRGAGTHTITRWIPDHE